MPTATTIIASVVPSPPSRLIPNNCSIQSMVAPLRCEVMFSLRHYAADVVATPSCAQCKHDFFLSLTGHIDRLAIVKFDHQTPCQLWTACAQWVGLVLLVE